MLKGKKILLGVTGSIAAYKAAYLVRLLVKEQCEVKVLMTKSAQDFITPLTLSTLSKNPVNCETFDKTSGQWNSHIDLGYWADVFLIAPATASSLAKIAIGMADNLLVATYLAARCPVWIAPAMDVDMFRHEATKSNIQTLRNRGVHIIEPASGELASGLIGEGRMEEPDVIVKELKDFFSKKKTPRPQYSGYRRAYV